MKRLLVFCIALYQRTLSLDHGVFAYRHPNGFCRYYPTCSEYAKQSIQKEGVIIGSIKSFLRVIRCNPFSKGGFDPV